MLTLLMIKRKSWKLISMLLWIITLLTNAYKSPPYKIHPNSIEFVGGKLKLIQSDKQNVYFGSKSIIFQVSKALNAQISVFVTVKSNLTRLCGNDIYVKYLSPHPTKGATIEVCGSNGCQLVCQNFDTKTQRFTSQYYGVRLIPASLDTAAEYFFKDNGDVFAAVPSDSRAEAVIARHLQRARKLRLTNVVHTTQHTFGTFKNDVHFIKLFEYGNHTYFLFTETALETVNFHTIFHPLKNQFPRRTRIGRICDNDGGIFHKQTSYNSKITESLFTTFLRAPLSCTLEVSATGGSDSGNGIGLHNAIKEIHYTQAVAVYKSIINPDIFTVLYRPPPVPEWLSGDSAQNFFYWHQQSKPFSHMRTPLPAVLCQYNITEVEQKLLTSKIAVLGTNKAHYWYRHWPNIDAVKCKQNSTHLFNKEWLVLHKMKSIAPSLPVLLDPQYGAITSMDATKSVNITLQLPNSRFYSISANILLVGTEKGFIGRAVILDKKPVQRLLQNPGEENNKLSLSPYYRRWLNDIHREVTVAHVIRLTYAKGEAVRQLMLDKEQQTFLAVGDNFVQRLSMAFCNSGCRVCNSHLDPFCQWNPRKLTCEINPLKWSNHQTIRIYGCNPGTRKNKEPVQVYDSFWLTFSIVLVVSVFVIVLTVSIVVRYHHNIQVSNHHLYNDDDDDDDGGGGGGPNLLLKQHHSAAINNHNNNNYKNKIVTSPTVKIKNSSKLFSSSRKQNFFYQTIPVPIEQNSYASQTLCRHNSQKYFNPVKRKNRRQQPQQSQPTQPRIINSSYSFPTSVLTCTTSATLTPHQESVVGTAISLTDDHDHDHDHDSPVATAVPPLSWSNSNIARMTRSPTFTSKFRLLLTNSRRNISRCSVSTCHPSPVPLNNNNHYHPHQLHHHSHYSHQHHHHHYHQQQQQQHFPRESLVLENRVNIDAHRRSSSSNNNDNFNDKNIKSQRNRFAQSSSLLNKNNQNDNKSNPNSHNNYVQRNSSSKSPHFTVLTNNSFPSRLTSWRSCDTALNLLSSAV